jgi:hypothetical protein
MRKDWILTFAGVTIYLCFYYYHVIPAQAGI